MSVLETWSKEGRIPSEAAKDYILATRMHPSGTFLPQAGILSKTMGARKAGKKGILLHPDQAEEAAIVNDLAVIPVENQEEAILFLPLQM